MPHMNLGNNYKIIRKNKGYTQKEVCQDKLTIATLSKFENGRSMPSYSLISHLLYQVNMSFDEFEYLCAIENFDEEKQLLSKFETIISNSVIKATRDLKINCEKYLSHHQSKKIEELKMILELSLKLYDEDFSKNFSNEVKQITLELWNTLAVKKEWYISELKLLNQILFYFPDDLIFDVTDRILERLTEYDLFQKMAILKTSILINLSTVYLYHSQVERCEEILQWAYCEAQKLKRYDFISICLIRLGICQTDKKMIKKGMTFLQLANETEMEKEFRKEIKIFS
ncbi:helix-turn-helix domain-containing protein [Lactococcus petauri]|uniref:helix-turn-helix domain-containing protein n=1 Tax=Lactococcus petauri TaxID=1940789 RepID=UPI00178225D5|nr:helix-turn-helix transcriptional regulator [Lactococcus petauri]MBD5823784.1 XRE family transcriptional regulator [Lactococcus petauri]